jgi:hypothetical protein
MEELLGALSPERSNTRVAADLICLWRYDYAERVEEICAIIGGSRHTALRLHYQVSPNKRQEFIDYAEALGGWLGDIPPDDASHFRAGAGETTQKIYRFLGKPDPLKRLLVDRTYLALSARFLNCSFWGHDEKSAETTLNPHTAQDLDRADLERLAALERRIEGEMGHAAEDFLCDVGGSTEPACHFKFIRRIDILVSSIGCMDWRGNLPTKDEQIRGRRQKTALLLDILEKYWNGKPTTFTGDDLATENKLFALMGEPNDFKRWLAASLWKNLNNQTSFDMYPMGRWVEFVQIGEHYMDTL